MEEIARTYDIPWRSNVIEHEEDEDDDIFDDDNDDQSSNGGGGQAEVRFLKLKDVLHDNGF